MACVQTHAQEATIKEELIEFTTYPFSEPDPVPKMNRIYPYFYFDGYTNTPVQQKWKMVVLENEYIKVWVCPDIGGKVWGAVEKSTGGEFIYFNHVVKFRDIAMRGAWTSGGLEYNFGDIGHIPTCATPVDYTIKEHDDGGVSCSVGAIDLPSGTRWNVEVKVSPGKAYFETTASWFNNTELPCTYYHWMNAAAKASMDLEFIYPGQNWIGHGGEFGTWPKRNGRELNWYKNNDFGSYKSYHVVNSHADFFGGYWHDEDFGFGHFARVDDKPGKKLWIWGLANEGMIWEQLLTDTNGQYIEFQAGKLFNQAAGSSTRTPFKHREFAPHDADVMKELWFPLKGTKGMAAASPWGVLNIVDEGNGRKVLISALQTIDEILQVFVNGQLQHSEKLSMKPLELADVFVEAGQEDDIRVVLGDHKLVYSTRKETTLIERPLEAFEDFNWESAYGLYVQGLELEKQRDYARSKGFYEKALEVDAGFLPALNRVAMSQYRQMNYAGGLETVRKSLAIDTYDGEANYLLGLISRKTGDVTSSKSGFSIAMGSVTWRSAAATELANAFLAEKDWSSAESYALKALAFNKNNLDALEVLVIVHRKTGDRSAAEQVLGRITALDGTHPFPRFEAWLLSNDARDRALFLGQITNELPLETFLDLAIGYANRGCTSEALEVLDLAPDHPVADLWLASLDPELETQHISEAVSQPPDFVFPHRVETAELLRKQLKKHPHWKLHYYLGLILWDKGLLHEARQQFAACGDAPVFAPFYLAKSRLVETPAEQLECLLKAAALVPDDWRAGLALANFYLDEENPDEALSIIQPFVAEFPEQSAVGLCYAMALVARHDYSEAIAFLERYELLPFEGATFGRELFNEACLRSAFRALENGHADSAAALAEKAKRWPVNLGVGRPYNVDERLEDQVLALACASMGEQEKAGLYWESVREYEHPDYRQENASLYLQLVALSRNGQKARADSLLLYWSGACPENKYIHWASAKIAGTPEAGQLEEEISQAEGRGSSYGPLFRDKRFPLLLDFLESIEH